MRDACFRIRLDAEDYDLGATLESGQAFRWERRGKGQRWEGVVGRHWVALEPGDSSIVAETVADPEGWHWLRKYLQVDVPLGPILASFPKDPLLEHAVTACRGLRLVRQEPWECLASFLLSSNKQIVQIRQGVRLLCERFGTPLVAPGGAASAFQFPSAAVLAGTSEADLRACRIGFRARYLLETSKVIAAQEERLAGLADLPVDEARAWLMALPGVGRKIADCVLLFAFGFVEAFPVDVWILRALRELYFHGRESTPALLRSFSQTHFGPWGGYAQQYLFHFMRLRAGRAQRSHSGSDRLPLHAP